MKIRERVRSSSPSPELEKPKFRIMLDSGAFSAWTRGVRIDLKDFMRYCLDYQPVIETIVNLDMIPGAPGRRSSPAEVEESAKVSFKNWQILRKAGLPAIPVFHRGERHYWLEKMIGEGAEYISLGALVGVPSRQRREFLDEVFSYLCGDRGFPSVKVHGLGVTSMPIVFRYPWYSVDSVSWLLGGGMGMVRMPRVALDGSLNWDEPPIAIALTEWKDRREGGAPRFERLPKATREVLANFLISAGFKIDEVRTNHLERKRANAFFFHAALAHRKVRPFRRSTPSLLGGTSNLGRVTPIAEHSTIFFVVDAEGPQDYILVKQGIAERLFSFFYLSTSRLDLTAYASGGWTRNSNLRQTRSLKS